MNYALLLPEFLLAGLAFIVLGADLLIPSPGRKHLLAYVSVVGLVVVIAATFSLLGQDVGLFGGLLLVDGYAVFFKFFFLVIAVFIILASVDFVKRDLRHPGEYYGLILISTLAMMLMTSAAELITAYISLELLSFSLYVLAAYAKDNPKSNEAGVKYILLGAFSSSLLLYGMSLIYGVTLTTSFEGIAGAIMGGTTLQPVFFLGLVLIMAGLGFKIAAVPFHMWAPDVYEGAPVPITAYLAVASKAAGFGLLMRLFASAFLPAIADWRPIIAGLSLATMTVGNLVALRQRNIKRMLAYSSIGQVGYLLMGVAALSPMAVSAILLHLAGYAATNLAVFVCVIVVYNLTGKDDIPDYAGLSDRAPFIAFAMSIALLSLAGLPFFAGFATKFYLFTAAAKEGFLWLVAVAVINSLISLYYYLMVMRQMYINPAADKGRLPVPLLLNGVVGVLTVLVVVIGVYPAPLLQLIEQAANILF